MSRLLQFCCIAVLWFCHTQLYAQTDTSAYKKLRDTYITDLTHKVNITPYFLLAGNGFELVSNHNIRVLPNEFGSIGLRVSHGWLTVGLSVGVKNLQSEKKGTTEFVNFKINTYQKKWGLDGYYHSYKGHYVTGDEIENTTQFLNTQTYPIVPNLHTQFMGINAYYISNHQKYSYRASFIVNEIQKKSAGSFILMLSYSFFKLNSDTGFVPGKLQPNIPVTSQIIDGSFNSWSIMPGYAYTLVIAKKYFITLSPSIGLMTQFQNYTTKGATEKGVTDGNVIYPRAMARGAMGYNGKKWYCTVSAIVDNYIIRLPEQDLLIYNIGNASLNIGFRINVPKRFRRLSKTINELAPENIINDITH